MKKLMCFEGKITKAKFQFKLQRTFGLQNFGIKNKGLQLRYLAIIIKVWIESHTMTTSRL